MAITYKDSGVDIESGDKFVKKIAPIVKSTFSDRVITDIGGFGALYSGEFPEMKAPILVSGTDGVGTKLKIAQLMNVHNTIGIDAVAMCVNDILTSGAKPLFFLDYIACGKINEKILVDVVRGLADGCKTAGCSLIGGETAEHPDLMAESDYDIAGFALGVVDKEKIINGSSIKKGDVVIGLSSSGLHSNGYSLVRKLLLDIKKYELSSVLFDLPDTLGNVLLTPTKIYCSSIISCIEKGYNIKGMIHITGGGFYENIPRILTQNTAVKIERKSLNSHPIFRIIQEAGDIEDIEMFTTFNMGTGFILITGKEDADAAVISLKESGEDPRIIGEITEYTGKKVSIS